MAGIRKIIHIDMDAFYASVEQRDHPEYRGKPLAVGRAEERGVVAAASYEARRFGVHSAMSSMRALKLCPELIFVPGRMEHYKAVSREIRGIFREYTDLIEPLSLDEAFLDVTQNKPGIELAVDIAREIKASIKAELGLTASAGVSYNKLLAKIASDWRKPDGLCTIHPQAALKFIDQKGITISFKKQRRICGGQTAGISVVQSNITALRFPDMVQHRKFSDLTLSADHDDRIIPGSVQYLLL